MRSNPQANTLDKIKKDIIDGLTYANYDAYKNDPPYINMKYDEMDTAMRDLATIDVEELIKEARADERQAVISALPKRKKQYKNPSHPVDNMETGWNNCLDQIESEMTTPPKTERTDDED